MYVPLSLGKDFTFIANARVSSYNLSLFKAYIFVKIVIKITVVKNI